MSLNLDFCLQLNEIWDDTVNWSFSYIPISIQIWISIWVPLSNVLYFQKRSTLLNYQLQVSRFVWELALVNIPFCKFCISLHFIRLSSICGPLMSICVGYFFFLFRFLDCFVSFSFFYLLFFVFRCGHGMLWSIYKHWLAKVNLLLCEYIWWRQVCIISAKRFHNGQRIMLNFLAASDHFQWECTTLTWFYVSEKSHYSCASLYMAVLEKQKAQQGFQCSQLNVIC